MAEVQHVVHSIPPTYDEFSRVLVLGSMPSPASRAMGYNYGHPRNRFWRVLSELAGEPLPVTNERKRDFCLRHHIALWDVLTECDIEGAADATIANAIPNRLTQITQSAPIEAVFCTGAKAHGLYRRYCEADVGIPAVKLPSTSPANAACSLERLMKEYAAILEHEHPFVPLTLDVPDVVALEQSIAAAGTPLSELMDRAGTAVAHRASQLLVEKRPQRMGAGHRVVVLCGNGNNGGDGWVAAALLAQAGESVCLITAKQPHELKAQPARDAAIAASATLENLGARVMVLSETEGGGRTSGPCNPDEGDRAEASLVIVDDGMAPSEKRAMVGRAITQAQVVVDALMGTGSAKAPRYPFSSWIEATEALGEDATVLAVDIPSGIDAQTGEMSQPHITASETITMIVSKPGLSAPDCGRVVVAPLAHIEPLLVKRAGIP